VRPSFARITVTRLRYPVIDDHGTEVRDYAVSPAAVDIPGWWVEPVESTENNDGQLAVTSGYTAVGPFTADITADDHVIVFGVKHQVIGDVLRVPSPTGALSETKATFRRWQHAGAD
jgi:hypothetical protein